MEILVIILLILLKSDKNKDNLTPIINALLENKELLSSIMSSAKSAPPTPEAEESKPETEKAAPEEDGKTEAIEKFLNSYFR